MVLSNELILLGGMGVSAWKILKETIYGKQAKNAKSLEESFRHALREETNKRRAAGGSFCPRAKIEGQMHVVADWEKLPLPMKDSLAYDLAQLAAWSNDKIKISSKPWAELSPEEKQKIVDVADQMSFAWLKDLHMSQANKAAAWLWEPSDPIPAMAREVNLDTLTLTALHESQTKLDACKEAAEVLLNVERLAKLAELKEAGEMLQATKILRDLQIIKTLMEAAGVDTTKSESERGAELRASLAGLHLSASTQLEAEVEAAKKLVEDSRSSAVEEARAEKMAALEMAASKAAVEQRLAAAADAKRPEQWKVSSLMWNLMCVEMMLERVSKSSEGQASREELQASVQKLVAKLAASINFEVPAEMSEALAGSAPESVAAELADELATAAVEKLEEEEAARVAKAQANKTPEQIVRFMVASMMDNVSGVNSYVAEAEAEFAAKSVVEMQEERNRIREAVEAEMEEAAAKKREADLAALEKELEVAGTKAVESALQTMAEDLGTKSPSEQIAYTAMLMQSLESSGASDIVLLKELSLPLLLLAELPPGTLAPEAEEKVAIVGSELRTLKLGADVARLEPGPGCVDVLLRMEQYISAKLAAAEAGEAPPVQEEGEEAAAPAPPQISSQELAKAKQMIDGLLSQGLVLLELPLATIRKLQMIWEAINSINYQSSDKALFSRCLKTLEGAVESELPPVAAAVEARLAALSQAGEQSSDPRVKVESMREVFSARLEQQRTQAIQVFQALNAYLKADKMHGDMLTKNFTVIRDKLAGIKVHGRRVDQTEEGISAVREAKELVVAAVQAMKDLKDSEDVHSDMYIFETKLEELAKVLEANLRYNRLREYYLGKMAGPSEPLPVPCPTDKSVGEIVQHVAVDSTLFEVLELTEEDAITAMGKEGLKLISRGQVAVCSIAAEVKEGEVRVTQDVGLPSTKALLQVFAERLAKVQVLAAESAFGPGAEPMSLTPWYIMTTPEAKPAVDAFLSEGHYFGLDPHQVHVFAYTSKLPNLRLEGGGILMETPGRVSKSPISAGDLLPAMEEAGMLKHMQGRGIKYLDLHSREDNLLAKPADPTFVGYLHSSGLEGGAKVMERAHLQKLLNDITSAAEPPSKGGEGLTPGIALSLLYSVPCTGQYCITMAMAKSAARFAKHLVRCSPADGIVSRGSKVAGYRLERRLSDILLDSRILGARGLMVVEPSEEWSLVWGASTGAADAATAAVDALLLLHTRWVEAAGGTVPDVADGVEELVSNVVEVAPMVSYAGEGLEELVAGRTFKEAYDLDLQGFAPQARKKNSLGTWMIPFGVVWLVVAGLKLAKR